MKAYNTCSKCGKDIEVNCKDSYFKKDARRNKYIKLCRIDRKKCRKECLAPDKSCPFIKKVLRC